MGGSSRKTEYGQAFPQAELDEHEHIYIYFPHGFHADGAKHGSDFVIKLKGNFHNVTLASYN